MNDCINPNLMPGVSRSSLFACQQRRPTQLLRAFRNDLVGSNILFTTYNTLKLRKRHIVEPASTGNRVKRQLDWLPAASPETHQEP